MSSTPMTTPKHPLSEEAVEKMARALRELMISPPTGIPLRLSDHFSEKIARAAWDASPGPGLAAALQKITIYSVEEQEDVLLLAVDGYVIADFAADSAEAIVLLKLDSQARAALARLGEERMEDGSDR